MWSHPEITNTSFPIIIFNRCSIIVEKQSDSFIAVFLRKFQSAILEMNSEMNSEMISEIITELMSVCLKLHFGDEFGDD